MFDFATAWLLQHKVLLPAASTLTRIIGEIRERANRRLWRKLASLPDSWQTAQLAGLLEIPEGQRVSWFFTSLTFKPRFVLRMLGVTLPCRKLVMLLGRMRRIKMTPCLGQIYNSQPSPVSL